MSLEKSHKRSAKPLAMVVEDEGLIAYSLEDALQELDFEVAGPFASCADALEYLASGALPDIAILDALLRDGTCLDLARVLSFREVPFLIYSGRDAFEEQPPELDGIPWIEKPQPPEAVARSAVALLKPGAGPR